MSPLLAHVYTGILFSRYESNNRSDSYTLRFACRQLLQTPTLLLWLMAAFSVSVNRRLLRLGAPDRLVVLYE